MDQPLEQESLLKSSARAENEAKHSWRTIISRAPHAFISLPATIREHSQKITIGLLAFVAIASLGLGAYIGLTSSGDGLASNWVHKTVGEDPKPGEPYCTYDSIWTPMGSFRPGNDFKVLMNSTSDQLFDKLGTGRECVVPE